MLTSASTSRTLQSVLEAPVGQAIIHFQDLWLTGRVLAPEGEEADFVTIQIHFTADQAARPHGAQRPGLAQQVHRTLAVTAAQVDQPALGAFLQVQFPARWEGPPPRRRFDPRRPALAQRPHVAARTPLQRLQVFVLQARPDPGLPPTVGALDHGLEARLV